MKSPQNSHFAPSLRQPSPANMVGISRPLMLAMSKRRFRKDKIKQRMLRAIKKGAIALAILLGISLFLRAQTETSVQTGAMPQTIAALLATRVRCRYLHRCDTTTRHVLFRPKQAASAL